MIVVIGPTYLRGSGPDAEPDGLAGRIAVAAASAGSRVELVSKLGDDSTGDDLLLALARAGVGHVAVLRDAVHPTALRSGGDEPTVDGAPTEPAWSVEPGLAPALEPADVQLALRYLADYRVIVAAQPSPAILAEIALAADWAAAHLVLLTRAGDGSPDMVPIGTLALEIADEPDDAAAIAVRLGAYAAAVDRGEEPGSAFTAVTAGSEPA